MINGELMVIIHPRKDREDGDILFAPNSRRIKCVHAENVCHRKHHRRNRDGLHRRGGIAEALFSSTHQYRFFRVGAAVERHDLFAGGLEVFDKTPRLVDGKMQHIDVERYLAKAIKHERHKIFGVAGSEVWYGGRIDTSTEKVDKLWTKIQEKSPHRLAPDAQWPFTRREKRNWLILPVEDFGDDAAAEYVAPEIDDSDPENPVEVKFRKLQIRWRDELHGIGGVEADVLNRKRETDLRGGGVVRKRVVRRKSKKRGRR